jgi:subtilisin family serine protease
MFIFKSSIFFLKLSTLFGLFGLVITSNFLPIQGYALVPDLVVSKTDLCKNISKDSIIVTFENQKKEVEFLSNNVEEYYRADSFYQGYTDLTKNLDQRTFEIKTNYLNNQNFVANTEAGSCQSVLDLVSELNKKPGIIAEVNSIYTVDSLPNDTFFSTQWALNNTGQTGGTADIDINAPEAWDALGNYGSNTIKIAVIDSGVQFNHADLSGNLLPGIDYFPCTDVDSNLNCLVPNTPVLDYDASDALGHGTHISGIIAGKPNNATGIAGICGNCKILPVKVFHSDALAPLQTLGSKFLSGLSYAINSGVKIISLSLSTPNTSASLQSAVQAAIDSGITIVASTGNASLNGVPYYPAAYPGVIGVGSINHSGTISSFSNRGNFVDLVAPGEEIYSTYISDGGCTSNCYAYQTGTSMSSPYVAGVAGLILSKNPNYNPAEVQELLKLNAMDLGTSGYDTTYGYGLVRADKVIKAPLVNFSTPTKAQPYNPGSGVTVVATPTPFTGNTITKVDFFSKNPSDPDPTITANSSYFDLYPTTETDTTSQYEKVYTNLIPSKYIDSTNYYVALKATDNQGNIGVKISQTRESGYYFSILPYYNSFLTKTTTFGYSTSAGGWSSQNDYPRMVADMNNDGRTDIVGFGNAGTLVSYQNADGTFAPVVVAVNNFEKL